MIASVAVAAVVAGNVVVGGDPVTRLEAGNVAANPFDYTAHFVSQNATRPEKPVDLLKVRPTYPASFQANEDVSLAQLGNWNLFHDYFAKMFQQASEQGGPTPGLREI